MIMILKKTQKPKDQNTGFDVSSTHFCNSSTKKNCITKKPGQHKYFTFLQQLRFFSSCFLKANSKSSVIAKELLFNLIFF